jgi:diguanylate cyclase (GGDEF)-like protein
MERRTGLAYALCTAAAAAVGLLFVRAALSFAPSLKAEFSGDPLTYVYVFVVTAVVFLALGYVLGRRIDEFRRLSTTDPLTGLANRRAFEDRLREEWLRSRRYGTPLSLLMVDIDGLKRINDEQGHAAGDAVLRAAAAAIAATLRRTDFGARWGGDEFAILSPSTKVDAAERLGQRLIDQLRRQSPLEKMPVTASIGVSTFDQDDAAASMERLWEFADAALYQAKHDGRNRVKLA